MGSFSTVTICEPRHSTYSSLRLRLLLLYICHIRTLTCTSVLMPLQIVTATQTVEVFRPPPLEAPLLRAALPRHYTRKCTQTSSNYLFQLPLVRTSKKGALQKDCSTRFLSIT